MHSSPKTRLSETLASLDLPSGLLSSAYQSYQSCNAQLWLLDNSSHMNIRDSHVGRHSSKGNKEGSGVIERVDNATRWEELQDCVAFHAKLASKCWIPTKYFLVNDPSSSTSTNNSSNIINRAFGLCWGSKDDVPSEMNHIRNIMTSITCDQHQCPLTLRLRTLTKSIAKEAPSMMAQDRRTTVVICTQGLPTDSKGSYSPSIIKEFQRELMALSKLPPVKVIIRLCTDNDEVRDMFNTLDGTFESVDVLDDFWGESQEVYLHNPWLTYTMGLHRLRESGLAPDLLDDLDEEPLSLDDIHKLCTMLFLGEDGCISLPHPRTSSWNTFFRALTILVEKEKDQWNPVLGRPTPWINLRKLENHYGDNQKTSTPMSDGRSKRDSWDFRGRVSSSDTSEPKYERSSSERRPSWDHRSKSTRDSWDFSAKVNNSDAEPNMKDYRSRPTRDSWDFSASNNTSRPKRESWDFSSRANNSDAEPNNKRSSSESHVPPKKTHTHSNEQPKERSSSKPHPSQDKNHSNSNPQSKPQHQPKHTHSNNNPQPKSQHQAKSAMNGKNKTLALEEFLKQWSHRPPHCKIHYPLHHLLLTIPSTFPPLVGKNTEVEPHEYFYKWKTFDKEAFVDVTGDGLKELLKRAVRKAKFFLHPDKLPTDLTENQALLFQTIWHVIQDREMATFR